MHGEPLDPRAGWRRVAAARMQQREAAAAAAAGASRQRCAACRAHPPARPPLAGSLPSPQAIVEYLKRRTATKEAAKAAAAAAKAASAAAAAAKAAAAVGEAAAAGAAGAGGGQAAAAGPKLLPGGVNLFFSEEEFDAGELQLAGEVAARGRQTCPPPVCTSHRAASSLPTDTRPLNRPPHDALPMLWSQCWRRTPTRWSC